MSSVETSAPPQGTASTPEAESPISPLAQEQTAVPPPTPDETSRSPKPYSFSQPALVSGGEARKLRLRHEEFARALATRLSMHLRLEFGCRLNPIDTVTYRQFIESKPNQTYLTLFKIEGLEGLGLLELPPRLGIALVDRLMGGPGTPMVLARELSEIEMALLDQVIQIALQEWCRFGAELPESRPSILGHETQARFLQATSNDTRLLLVSLEVRLGECVETVVLALPDLMIEPILRNLSPAAPPSPSNSASRSAPTLRWNPELDEVTIPLDAAWSGLDITVRQLSELKVGDVLPVAMHHCDQVQVRLASVSKFVGRLGRKGSAWAVELTQAIPG